CNSAPADCRMTMVSRAPGRRSRNAFSCTAAGAAPGETSAYRVDAVATIVVSARVTGRAGVGARPVVEGGVAGAAAAPGASAAAFAADCAESAAAETTGRFALGKSLGTTTMTRAISTKATTVRLSIQ